MNATSDAVDPWRLTMQHSPIGMVVTGLDGRLRDANRAMCEMLGYEAADLELRGFPEITHPDDVEENRSLFHQALAGEIDTYRMRKRYLHASGRIVWGDLSVALIRDPDGAPLHFISQILDVTEQHEAEEKLTAANDEAQRERQTLEAIFETVSVGLLLIGSDGSYQKMNRRHAQTMSLPYPDGHDGLAGQLGDVYLLDGLTLMSKEQMPTYRAVRGEEFDDVTFWVGRDPRRRLAYSVSARQVLGPSGESRGAALAYQDVTDLLRAMQVQDEFVASVSHEIRTPLSSVLGYLEILADTDGLPAEVSAQLGIIQRNALRLQALLSDLLHVGQMGGEGSLLLEPSPVDLVLVVADAVQAVLPQADAAGVDVRLDVPDRLTLDVDEQRIRQVLDNLLSNAVKYSLSPGAVRVSMRRETDAVVLEVADDGIGVPSGEVTKVFDRFFRGASAVRCEVAGTGLGLNIVRSIVEAHGGSVTLDSEVGRGSTFRVRLPAVSVPG
ncbi:hypothetical protein BH11ACT8_BH11ACT8_18710 [soil metagenome]